MFDSLEGRSAIVTGASKGIGRGLARRFGRAGCHVIVVSRHLPEAQRVADEIAAAGGDGARAGGRRDPRAGYAGDGACGGGVARRHRHTVRQRGNIPGRAARYHDRIRLRCRDGTNLKGTFLAVSACLPAMKKKKRGRIILTSSITGPVTGFAGWSHYGASKAGQLGFMRTAAIELAPHGITVNAVLPGNILTEGLVSLGEEYMRTMAASIPMRRLGSIEDIANAALFFASDEAGYITGQGLVIDGGQILPESLGALAEP